MAQQEPGAALFFSGTRSCKPSQLRQFLGRLLTGRRINLMTEHAFKIGDEVRLVGRIAASPAEAFLHLVTLSERTGAAKPWQIVRLLPPDGVGFPYHVRCPIDGSERIAHESELARDGR